MGSTGLWIDWDPAWMPELVSKENWQHIVDTLSDLSDKPVQKIKDLVEFMVTINLIYVLTIPPGNVGVHDENRDGTGLAWADVHSLCVLVLCMGWLDNQWALCTEIEPCSKTSKFNTDLFASALGRLGNGGAISYASLAASHCNAMLRLFIGEGATAVKTDDKTLSVCENGKFCT
jgi:hypothetical protein